MAVSSACCCSCMSMPESGAHCCSAALSRADAAPSTWVQHEEQLNLSHPHPHAIPRTHLS